MKHYCTLNLLTLFFTLVDDFLYVPSSRFGGILESNKKTVSSIINVFLSFKLIKDFLIQFIFFFHFPYNN